MKRSTCKMLLGIGIFLILIVLLFWFGMHFSPFFNPVSYIGIVLIIISLAKWNSEEENKEVKQAQLRALKRGRVNVNLKGKMRKLK